MGQGERRSVGRAGLYWPFCRAGVLSLGPDAGAIVVSKIEGSRRREKI